VFAKLSRRLPVLALGSPNATLQPVYVATSRIASSCDRRRRDDRQRYPCAPTVYTLHELSLVARSPTLTPVLTLARRCRSCSLRARALPGKLMSRDNLASMQKDSVCGCDFSGGVGIAATALEAVAPSYLAPGAARSHYDDYRRTAALSVAPSRAARGVTGARGDRARSVARADRPDAAAATPAVKIYRSADPSATTADRRSPTATGLSSAPRPKRC